ncbi:MAG: hypothetical protein EOM20_19770, partial [Spartobacteria bacterium]|nr:hypothetical protein [Spartobacteria bacterium]
MSVELEFDGSDPITGIPYILVRDADEEGNKLTVVADALGSATLTLINISGTQGAVSMPANIVFEGEATDTSFEAEVGVLGRTHSGMDTVAIRVSHSSGGTAQSVEFYIVNRASDTDNDGLVDGTELDYRDPDGRRLNRFHWDTDRDGLDDQYEYTYRAEANGGSGLHPADPTKNEDDQNYNGDNDYMAYCTIANGVADHVNYHLAVYQQTANELYAGATAFNPRTAWGGADDARYTADYTATNEYLGGDRLPRYEYDPPTYATDFCVVTNVLSSDQTNPLKWDTDDDTMPDGWELYVGLNPNYSGDRGEDPDNDGLENWEEWGNYRDVNGNSGSMNSWSNKLWPTDPGAGQRVFAWQNVWWDSTDDGIYDPATDVKIWAGNWDSLHTNDSFALTNGVHGRRGPAKYPTYIAEWPEFEVIYDPAGGVGGTGSAWADDGDGVFSTNALLPGYPADIPSLILPPVEGDTGVNNGLYYYHNDFHPKDTDFDGLPDSTVTGGGEEGAKSNPTSIDTDLDFMPDGWERYAHADILRDDRDEDPDGDGLANNQEYWTGAVYEWMHIDPTWPDFYRIATRVAMQWDTKQGGSTGMRGEIPYYIPPHFADCPSFNVANGQRADEASEYAWYHTTRVDDPDSDYDGMDDYWEVFHGLNPLKGSRDIMMSPIPFTGGDRALGEGDQTGVFDADPATVGIFEIGEIFLGTTVFTNINNLIQHLHDNPGGLSYDMAVYTQVGPFNFGLELMDPDGDGLPNLEEYSYEVNCSQTGRKFYHTDPTPYIRTAWYPNQSDFSFPLWNYTFDNGWLTKWSWSGDGAFPFLFETTEGFDTDNDGIGDLAEVDDQIPALLGGSDPINSKNPARNRCLILDATNQDFLRTSDAWGAALPNQMNHFTVEAWVYVEDLNVTANSYV